MTAAMSPSSVIPLFDAGVTSLEARSTERHPVVHRGRLAGISIPLYLSALYPLLLVFVVLGSTALNDAATLEIHHILPMSIAAYAISSVGSFGVFLDEYRVRRSYFRIHATFVVFASTVGCFALALYLFFSEYTVLMMQIGG